MTIRVTNMSQYSTFIVCNRKCINIKINYYNYKMDFYKQ